MVKNNDLEKRVKRLTLLIIVLTIVVLGLVVYVIGGERAEIDEDEIGLSPGSYVRNLLSASRSEQVGGFINNWENGANSRAQLCLKAGSGNKQGLSCIAQRGVDGQINGKNAADSTLFYKSDYQGQYLFSLQQGSKILFPLIIGYDHRDSTGAIYINGSSTNGPGVTINARKIEAGYLKHSGGLKPLCANNNGNIMLCP